MKKVKPGAKVRVHSVSGEITSMFEGLVIARKHGSETGATFTVRSAVDGIGVEKVYPVNSPIISSVKIISSPKKVKKSKLYFLRNISKKRSRQKIGIAA